MNLPMNLPIVAWESHAVFFLWMNLPIASNSQLNDDSNDFISSINDSGDDRGDSTLVHLPNHWAAHGGTVAHG
jgi:hypothetical protein